MIVHKALVSVWTSEHGEAKNFKKIKELNTVIEIEKAESMDANNYCIVQLDGEVHLSVVICHQFEWMKAYHRLMTRKSIVLRVIYYGYMFFTNRDFDYLAQTRNTTTLACGSHMKIALLRHINLPSMNLVDFCHIHLTSLIEFFWKFLLLIAKQVV